MRATNTAASACYCSAQFWGVISMLWGIRHLFHRQYRGVKFYTKGGISYKNALSDLSTKVLSDYKRFKCNCNKVIQFMGNLWSPAWVTRYMQQKPWIVQSGGSVCPTGNGEKLSNSQVCCLAQLCKAVALFLSISHATSTPSTLYPEVNLSILG